MLKIYGSMLCPDCVNCCNELKEAKVEFQFCDFADSLLNLKEFLKLRDGSEVFDEIRAAGKIGIPCIQREEAITAMSIGQEFRKDSSSVTS